MIEIRDLNKVYHLKDRDVVACKDVNLSINEGEIYGIIGYSGAGKSSLVRCINLLEKPDSGYLEVNGYKLVETEVIVSDENPNNPISKTRFIKPKQLQEARKKIGMIFQHFNLLDRETVFDNVAYPLRYQGLSKKEIKDKVLKLLELVDLSNKAEVYPSQLSGGQKQRVAIARALANDPKVLLSDESTSALDPEATESILNLLKKLNKELNLTIVMITHEMSVIKTICDKVAVMENGCVVEQGDVYDVFANPQMDITKRFMASASSLGKLSKLLDQNSSLIETKNNEELVELQFGKDAVGDALISEVSRRFNVNISIVLANVEMLQNAPFGRLVARISGEESAISDTIAFITACNVNVKIIKGGK